MIKNFDRKNSEYCCGLSTRWEKNNLYIEDEMVKPELAIRLSPGRKEEDYH